MSDPNAFAFGKFIPGFDFLQQLAAANPRGAAPAAGLSNWVAPTVSVEEIDKRITELKAVQFWLDQNATALKATIQALEVQKMTLATLQGMNLSMAEVAKAFTLPTSDAPAASAPVQWPFGQAPAPADAAPAPSEPAAAPPQAEAPPEPPTEKTPTARARPKAAAPQEPQASPAAAGMADPMQWWGALTDQFQQIAANALRDAASNPMPTTAKRTAASAAAKPARAKPAPTRAAPAKSSSARKTAAGKKPAASAKSAKGTKGAARQPASASSGARAEATGWPLPPPFKTR